MNISKKIMLWILFIDGILFFSLGQVIFSAILMAASSVYANKIIMAK